MKHPATLLSVLVLLFIEDSFAQLQPLRVSDNRHFLVTRDGQPFFWLGDTGWELFHSGGIAHTLAKRGLGPDPRRLCQKLFRPGKIIIRVTITIIPPLPGPIRKMLTFPDRRLILDPVDDITVRRIRLRAVS